MFAGFLPISRVMQKDEIIILIVDDDQALGKAMSEILSRAGFKPMHCTKPDDALNTMKLQSVRCAIVDCMLPKMNGRELAKKMKEEDPNLPIIMMSGIYKDKNFIREAMAMTGAQSFLTKPFDLEDLLGEMENLFKDSIEISIDPLHSLLSKNDITHKERIRTVNEIDTIHAFDLPWLYSLLLHPRINGHLNIISAEGEVSGVGFQKGSIVQVNQEDAKSYFGVLLVEHGFISQADFDESMRAQGKAKKIGDRLVDANLISPHAVHVVMAEQQGIRLSKTVADTSVKVNFIESEEIRENAITDRVALTELLNEWLVSKVTTDWLKANYIPWMRYNVKRGPEFSPYHRVLGIPVVQAVPDIMKLLLEKETLEHSIAALKVSEEKFYRAHHALCISRVIRFGEQTTNNDYSMQRERLKKLVPALEKQNHFERLGVSQKAKDAEIKRAYHELAKILHPDKLAPDAPADVRELQNKAFEYISDAYETLDGNTKGNYIMELERGKAEAILQAEQLADQARPLMTKGDFKKARGYLETAVKLAPPSSDTRLLYMWSVLKTMGPERDMKVLSMLRDEQALIPPEDRHSALYQFVKGLLLKGNADYDGAKKSLEHAISMDADFIDARRELNALAMHANKPVDLLRGDLKDVVGLLFKKKK